MVINNKHLYTFAAMLFIAIQPDVGFTTLSAAPQQVPKHASQQPSPDKPSNDSSAPAQPAGKPSDLSVPKMSREKPRKESKTVIPDSVKITRLEQQIQKLLATVSELNKSIQLQEVIITNQEEIIEELKRGKEGPQ